MVADQIRAPVPGELCRRERGVAPKSAEHARPGARRPGLSTPCTAWDSMDRRITSEIELTAMRLFRQIMQSGGLARVRTDGEARERQRGACHGARSTRGPGRRRPPEQRQGNDARTSSLPARRHGPRDGLSCLWQGGVTPGSGGSTCVSTGAAELYVPAGVSLPPFRLPGLAPPSSRAATPEPLMKVPPAAVPFRRTRGRGPSPSKTRASSPYDDVRCRGGGGGVRARRAASPDVVIQPAHWVTFLVPCQRGSG